MHCRSPPSDLFLILVKQIGGKNIKNFKDSDYALNKFSKGIVYRFTDRIVEITLEDYLVENQGNTEQNFLDLKALSDEIHHQQVIDENRTSRLDVSMIGLEETEALATIPLDTSLIHKSDNKNAMVAAKRLLDSGDLTEVQRRRFILYFVEGLSYRQIAKKENVHQSAVWESLQWTLKKLRKLFDECSDVF